MNEILECKYGSKCAGCPTATSPFAPSAKLAVVHSLFPAAKISYAQRTRLRDRVDLIWENGKLGLYALQSREVVDLDSCPMMSEALERWFLDYRKMTAPIRKGSVRLRVSPSGERGVWLDFANQDVKTLFAEKSYLEWLSQHAFVEIGQRRKHLVWREGQPKLVDPELKAWFETYGPKGQAIPLYGPVGGFSQVGFAANRALVLAVCEFAEKSGVRAWAELFSGNGNFALALASRGHSLEAIEMDDLALQGLARSAAEQGLNIPTQRADIYLQTAKLPDFRGRGVMVDPPRAGLREVMQMLLSSMPQAVLYVSCFTETFVGDAEKLLAAGYRIEGLVGIEQFPYTPHIEWVSLFVKE